MKRKAKAIHAELRKGSQTFDGWLKYEVTIEYPNGKKEKVPAYGKDLQDALSRVAHDKKVEELSKTKLPVITIAVIATLIGVSFTLIGINAEKLGDAVGPVILGTVAVLTTLAISVNNWFSLQSKEK